MSDRTSIDRMRKVIFLTAYSSSLNSVHLASAFSNVEILYALYLKNCFANNLDIERDRVILSKGHAALALYAIMNLAGTISSEDLFTFCRYGSRIGGEPNMGDLQGIEATTGSLGHGLSLGVGMAMALKMDRRRGHVYVIIGDGECQEGIIWEAAMSAVKFGLDRLTVILDCNHIQKMGATLDNMIRENWTERWRNFGWNALEVENGNDANAVYQAISQEPVPGVPTIIIAKTVKGKGVSIMENNADWHFRMPNKRELKIVMQELGITEEELSQCRKHI